MKTTPVSTADSRGVFAVPPLARRRDSSRSPAKLEIVSGLIDVRQALACRIRRVFRSVLVRERATVERKERTTN
ncbi:MAG: hypothetical protein DMF73_01370 [Acidobacteria bacterium]|nr:MAG: hypothetical protein DMF73_01370 [Acidobacteriota bacterium]